VRRGSKAFGVKRTKYDALISTLVREANCWKCQRCGGDFSTLRQHLQASHVASRAIGWLRHDPRNITSLCAKCHSHLEARPIEHAEWYKSVNPEAYEFVKENQHKVRKKRVGEMDQMYKFYKAQKKKLDELRFDGYTGAYVIAPWKE
jgi:hypothetical protein